MLDLVRLLRSQNIPIIIISHQMYDIFSVTDRLVVMRRGKKVAERITKETNTDEVVGLITGSEEVVRNGAGSAFRNSPLDEVIPAACRVQSPDWTNGRRCLMESSRTWKRVSSWVWLAIGLGELRVRRLALQRARSHRGWPRSS